MSTHRIPVIEVGTVEAHPNADALDLVRVDGYTCVARKGQYVAGDLAVYIEPDYLVPLDRPEFEFLRPPNKPERTHQRIGVKRLRGVYSMGLLIPAPADCRPGDDLMGFYGIERYEPPEEVSVGTGGETEAPPYKTPIPVYDLENLRKYPQKVAGQMVVITEKIHGTNARYVWSSAESRLYAGSRREWKKPGENAYWRVLATEGGEWIMDWCKAHPDVILWGEVYGWVQDLRYGAKPGEVYFRAFDAYSVQAGTFWTPFELARSLGGVKRVVPWIYVGPCPDMTTFEALADDESHASMSAQMAEGIVVEVLDVNGWDADLQAWRIKLKLPGNKYLSR